MLSATIAGGALDVAFMLGKSADAGNPKKVLQLVEQALAVIAYEVVDILSHGVFRQAG